MHKSRCFRCRAGARGAGKRRMSARTEARVQPRRAKFASRTPLSWSARQRTSRAIVLWRPAREEGAGASARCGEKTNVQARGRPFGVNLASTRSSLSSRNLSLERRCASGKAPRNYAVGNAVPHRDCRRVHAPGAGREWLRTRRRAGLRGVPHPFAACRDVGEEVAIEEGMLAAHIVCTSCCHSARGLRACLLTLNLLFAVLCARVVHADAENHPRRRC